MTVLAPHPPCQNAIDMPPSKNTPTKRNGKAIYAVMNLAIQQLRSIQNTPNSAGLHAGEKDAKHLFFCVVSARAQQEILVHSRFWVTF